MIFDSIKNIENYKGMGRVYTALCFLSENDFTDAKEGRYDIEGDDIFYSVAEYDSDVNKTVAERHEKYIDIQYLISGEEYVGVGQVDAPKTLAEAKPENDIWLYECSLEKVTLKAGEFMVLFPNDLHMPGVGKEKSCRCKKVIVKVRA